MNTERTICVALENVRSAHNVGSIFRTADATGVAHLYLIGCTPTPIDRFGRPQPDIAKTALGAEGTLPWAQFETAKDFLEHVQGMRVVAVEQDPRAQNYREHAFVDDTVLVFGNEVDGVSTTLLDVADTIIELPMRGAKESLNVAVAAGVVLYHAS